MRNILNRYCTFEKNKPTQKNQIYSKNNIRCFLLFIAFKYFHLFSLRKFPVVGLFGFILAYKDIKEKNSHSS